MFMRLAQELANTLANQQGHPVGDADWLPAVNTVFRYRPVDLLDYLERYWAAVQGPGRDYVATNVAADERARRAFGEPETIGLGPENQNVRDPVDPLPGGPINPNPPGQIPPVPDPDNFLQNIRPVWPHLIYAYSLENTRIIDIFRKVLYEMLTGEKLGRPNALVLSWLRTTEELFFTDRLGYWIFSPVSRIRSDPDAIRRNAYYRMFGMDLNHGMGDGRPYPYQKPEAANRQFVSTFEQFLREVWRAYANRRNQIGPNFTDTAGLTDLVLRLHDMLRDRRLYGNLAREEFYSVATLSWFHLTVSANNQVVDLLRAQGNNAAERLKTISERVSIPVHTRSYNYFLMADELSMILSRIENWDAANDNVQILYDDVTIPNNRIPNDILTIINHWSAATGHNLKEFVGGSGDYLQQKTFAMSRQVSQGGNGHHSLVKTK